MSEAEETSIQGAATREALEKLWHAVLTGLTDYMEHVPREKRRAGHMALAVKFLADNGCTLATHTRDEAAEGLAKLEGMTLPFTKQ